jgi:hypothetical protein
MDLDPRWGADPRERNDRPVERSHGSRGAMTDPRDRASADPRDVFTNVSETGTPGQQFDKMPPHLSPSRIRISASAFPSASCTGW